MTPAIVYKANMRILELFSGTGSVGKAAGGDHSSAKAVRGLWGNGCRDIEEALHTMAECGSSGVKAARTDHSGVKAAHADNSELN